MRILVVDDETSVLQSLMAILRVIPGHDVRVAANAQKAHEQAAALGGVDLLISDVVMEPTDGFTLRGELQALYPAMRVVFVSGYDLSDYSTHLDGALVVAKPVDAGVLRGIVENSVYQLVTAAVAHQSAAKNNTPGRIAGPQPVAGTPSAAPRSAAQPAVAVAAQPQPVAQAAVGARTQPVTGGARAAQPQPQPMASGVRAAGGENGDPLVGVQLGDYRVQHLLGKGEWGSTYLAVQLSVNRPVGLKVLDLSSAQDDNARTHFLADARAKAAVQHPFIVSVFEADERNGLVFYTHEYLEGATLEELIQQSSQLDEKTALHVMKVAGEGLNYLWAHNLPHEGLNATSIRIGNDGIARLTNLATSQPDPNNTAEHEIVTLASLMLSLVPATAQSPGLRALLTRMSGGPNAVTSWPAVLQAVKALEPKVVPVEAAKIKAADAAALKAVEAVRKAQKRALILQLGTLGGLVILVCVFVVMFLVSNKRDLSQQIQIPAGTYLVGPSATPVTLGAFEIDKYEVTIGDYAKFIEFCQAESANEHKYDHPQSNQRHVTHATQDVLTLIKNAQVTRGGAVFGDNKGTGTGDPGIAIDLNCPMVGITFWDAYAYAKWKGRDLPTEEEWEAAARGAKGAKFPWGDELELKRFNSNAGYVWNQPGGNKSDDGYNYWSPVDQFGDDESTFKVVGMAGNVAEWVYKAEGAKTIPVVKGSSFASAPVPLFERMLTLPAEDCWYVMPAAQKKNYNTKNSLAGSNEFFFKDDAVTAGTRTLYIGFRTVKRK